MKTIISNIENTKFAYINLNRKVENNSELTKSIREKGILQPITVIRGNELEDSIYTHLNGKCEEIPNEEKREYFVILDGQHRIHSLMKILKEGNIKENIKQIPIIIKTKEEVGDINDYIISINSTAKNWKNSDYIKNANIRKNNDSLIKTIGAFNDMKFSISTISRYICLGSKYITKETLTEYLNGKSEIKYADYERAIRLYLFLRGKGFSSQFLKKRYLIDIIIESKKQNDTINSILNKINYLRRIENINNLNHNNIEDNIIKIIDEDYDEAINNAENEIEKEEIKKGKDYLSFITYEEIDNFLNPRKIQKKESISVKKL